MQKDRLWAMLNAAVSGLSDVPALVPTLRALGARHASYGVIPSHFTAVGDSLIYTLGKGLGDKFTAELKANWVGVYGVVKEQMLIGYNNPDNKTLVADKQAGYKLKVSKQLVPQCNSSNSSNTTSPNNVKTSDANKQVQHVMATAVLMLGTDFFGQA